MKVMMILEAVDRASRVLDKVESGLGRVAKMQDAINKAKDSARSNLIDSAASAAAIIAPAMKATNAFAEFEDQLADFGLVSDYTGDKLAGVGKQVKLLGPKVNKSASEMVKGLNLLVQGGLAPDKALQSIELISKASIATKATMEDLSKLSTGLINNLKIDPGAGLTKSLNILTQQAKDGNFELKAMARHLNDIVPIYASMGYKGQKGVAGLGAALQIIRTQTGTDEGAKTALVDFMYKLTDQKAVKAFKEVGIDIIKIMESAKKTDTFFESGLQALEMYTSKKGGIDSLNNLFGEKDSRTGARALLMNQLAFFEAREKGLQAGNVIEEDFLKRMGLTIEKQKALGVAINGFWLSVGTAINPAIVPLIESLTQWLNTLTKIVQANPELTAGVMAALAAFTSFIVVMSAIKFAALVLVGGFAQLSGVFVVLIRTVVFLTNVGKLLWGVWSGISVAVAAAGGWASVFSTLYIQLRLISALSFALVLKRLQAIPAKIAFFIAKIGGLRGAFMILSRVVTAAFTSMGAAMLANPVGLTIAAIAAGAALIYYNWDKLGPMFQALWAGFVTHASAAWEGIKAAAQGAWEWVSNGFTSAVEGIKGAFNGLVNFFSQLGGSLISGVQAAFAPVVDFIDATLQRISNAYESAKTFIGFGGGKQAEGAEKAANLGVTVAQATKANEQIKAIPPAATQAAGAANAVLASQDFQSHGVRLMETLAAGIRAGAASAVAAVAETVQKIRDHLPHSPAKIGPLSDLDRVQFSQTLAGAIETGAPRAFAAARMVAAGLAASIPMPGVSYADHAGGDAPSITRAAPQRGGAVATGDGANITVNFTVNVTGASGADDIKAQIEAALPALGHQIAQIVERETARANRLKY